ncbi:MAG: hypothetical protein Kow0063_25660 [Anaerolineae bacterium]
MPGKVIHRLKLSEEDGRLQPWSPSPDEPDVVSQVREQLGAQPEARSQSPVIPLDLKVEMAASRVLRPGRLVYGLIILLTLLLVAETLLVVAIHGLPGAGLFRDDRRLEQRIIVQLGDDLEPPPIAPPFPGVLAPLRNLGVPAIEDDATLPPSE